MFQLAIAALFSILRIVEVEAVVKWLVGREEGAEQSALPRSARAFADCSDMRRSSSHSIRGTLRRSVNARTAVTRRSVTADCEIIGRNGPTNLLKLDSLSSSIQINYYRRVSIVRIRYAIIVFPSRVKPAGQAFPRPVQGKRPRRNRLQSHRRSVAPVAPVGQLHRSVRLRHLFRQFHLLLSPGGAIARSGRLGQSDPATRCQCRVGRYVNENRITAALVCSVYAGDESGGLRSWVAADGGLLTSNTCVADVDVVISRGEIESSAVALNVIAAGSVIAHSHRRRRCRRRLCYYRAPPRRWQRSTSRCVAVERPLTDGGIVNAGCVAIEGKNTERRIIVARGVGIKCLI